MNEKKLFQYYFNLQSKEFREEILNYKGFKMKNTLCSIRVNFVDGSWIRVYQKLDKTIEWY